MGRRMHDIAWQQSAAALYERYRQETDLARRKRVQVLWLVRQGLPASTAAAQAGVGQRTALRWLGWYRHGGLEEVLRRVPGHGATGAACWLSPAQQAALLAQCRAGAFRTYGEAQRWVERTFGIAYRYHGIYRVLSRLEVHPKVPRPAAARADPAAQEAWKRGACGTR